MARYGFHHWAIGARDFEKAVAHYRALGYQEAFSDTAPPPLGCRVIYFDTTRDLPGMLEVIEINAATEEVYRQMYQGRPRLERKRPYRAPQLIAELICRDVR